MTMPASSTLERCAFLALAASLSLIQLTIVGGETLFDIAAILWVIILIRDGRKPHVPAFFLPLVVLAVWTLIGTAFSPNILASLREDKQLFLYLIVPVTMGVAQGRRANTVTNAIIAVGAIGAFVGIVQGVVLGYDDLNHRPHGLLGHYMTYSGVLMLVISAAAAQLIYREREWIWPAVAVPALLVALVVTESRNAWVGALLAIILLLVLHRRMLLVAVPVLVAVVLAVSPAVRSRVQSMFDPTYATNADRVSMLKSGLAMIKDHPLFGVGPNMVPVAYLEKYKRSDAVDPADQPGSTRAHLHDVPVQLAAERGLPALAAWVWFVVVAFRDLWRQTQYGPSRAIAAGGLAAVLAMVVAGLFEHNFGDSEFLLLFLGLVTLPFAARPDPPAAAPAFVRTPARPAAAQHATP
jgi:O-antigen ligase